MNFSIRQPISRLCSLAVLAFACTSLSYAQVSPTISTKLAATQTSPESVGALVYRGSTFALRVPSPDPLFRYERRVLNGPNGTTASNVTSDLKGRVIIIESASVSAHYEIHRFEALNLQAGFTGSVQISNNGRHLEYELNDNGKVTVASEDVFDPVISGPSMFGFILRHSEQLKAGTTMPVRMLVLKDKTTYGFDLKFEKKSNDQVSFTLTPSSFLIRTAVAPLRVVFDANTKLPVRYEGRVPPMENVLGKLKDLDARVEYTMVAPIYR
jgi:hypothetical protein